MIGETSSRTHDYVTFSTPSQNDPDVLERATKVDTSHPEVSPETQLGRVVAPLTSSTVNV
jgi:hypothetical protein